jgi:hypothetical protein
MFDFCVDSPDDAVLLTTFRRADFLNADLAPATRHELEHVNDPIAGRIRNLSRALFGRADQTHVELILIAVVDLPSAFAQRRIQTPTAPTRPYRARLEAAVRAMLDNP